MQPARALALGLGVAHVVAGAAGFIAGGFSGDGAVLGLAVSPLHNLVNLAIGLSGLAAYGLGAVAARAWCQGAGLLVGVMAVVGVVIPNPFGALHLGGADIAIHFVVAVVLLYVGFAVEQGYPSA